MALGLLINLVESEATCRATLAAQPLASSRHLLSLLCRLMQASNSLGHHEHCSCVG